MPSSFLQSLRRRFDRRSKTQVRPLISSHSDIAHIRAVRKQKLPTLKQISRFGRVLNAQERWVLRLGVLLFVVGTVTGGWQLSSRYRVLVPTVGGVYQEAVVGSPQLVNPLFASLNDVDTDLSRLMYSGLMRYDDKQRLIPDLAVSYELNEENTVYTFRLRKDIVWHDGTPFTSRDVLYTFDMVQDQQVNSPLRVSFQGVQVDAIDDYTVTFTLEEPFVPFLASLTLGILPEHMWGNFPASQLRSAPLNLEPIGTGPFEFDTLVKDPSGFITEYRLKRFENYYRRPPYIEEFQFAFFADYEQGSPSAIEALRQQTVDGLHFVPSMLRSQVARKHIDLKTLELPQYSALFFNQERQPALKDAIVREALALGIDKERIVRESLDGEGRVLNGPILPGFPGYFPTNTLRQKIDDANTKLDVSWPELSANEYRELRKEVLVEQLSAVLIQEARSNVPTSTDTSTSTDDVATSTISINTSTVAQKADEQAEELLDQEINDAQLFYRQNEDEELLEIRLVTADTNEYQQAAQRIAGFWQELGILTTIEYVHPRDISRRALKDRNYDVLLYGIIIGSDPDQYPFWHSSQAEFPGLNLAQYSNEEVDEWLVKAREATDTAELEELYLNVHNKIVEDRPAIFLYTPTYTYAVSDRVQGITGDRIFTPADRFASVTDWYLETRSLWQFN